MEGKSENALELINKMMGLSLIRVKNGVIEDELRDNKWIRDWCKGKDKDMGQ